MEPRSAVIDRINDSTRTTTRLYTVDTNPGYVFGRIQGIDDRHSTTWWATAHIQVDATTHSGIWNGTFDEAPRLERFATCAVSQLAGSDRCAASNAIIRRG
jgi:hypothetical protein